MSATHRVLLCLSLAGALAACSKPQEPPAPIAKTDPMLVEAGASLVASLKVEEMHAMPVSPIFRVAGRVDFDERRISRISTTVPGRISDIKVVLGQNVGQGALLATLTSADLGEAQLAYIKSNSYVHLMRRSVERAKALYAADVIGSAELQRRENELEVAEAEKRGAADQLRLLGLRDGTLEGLERTGSISSVKPVVSTQAGTVVERNVALGQVVQPSDPLFVVADLAVVRVMAEVPEQEARGIDAGQNVNIEVPALGMRRVARLNYVSPTVNPDTRTILVRTDLDNRDRSLKPAMLATVEIASAPQDRIALLPSAIVRENNTDHVFVEVGPGKFRMRPVVLGHIARGPDGEEVRPVLEGLANGERVVVDGAFHLNTQRKSANQ
ncbi:MAG: efflux RND transporter periplasmic adaptor subunit [Rhodocyclaceae bacterium]|nr:efflux RND transporter periplasmic adaptor subunit [Rhodocyclaceae bacterium]